MSVGAAGVVRQSLTYGYNANNEMTAITDGAIGSVSTTYTYDELSRLKTQTWPSNGFVDAWSYDATGNRTAHTWNQAPSALSNDPTSNRLQLLTRSGAPDQAFEYDPRGNITATAGTSYAYDAFNRMRSASRATAATVTEPNYANHTYPAGTTTYSYNALDQRVAKTGTSGTTRFIYSGQNQMLAENGPGGWRSYIWAGNELLGIVNPNGYTYYIHTNHLGKPESATHQNKTMVWRSYNWAFDRHIPLDSIGGLNIGFPGQYYDAETGNWYNGFRDYDARIGRYLQSDPIGLAGGSNTYAYVGGDPISYVDPLGLEGVGSWTYPAGPMRDQYYAAQRGEITSNFSIGAGGFGQFGVNTVSIDSGLAVDTRGTVCVYSNICPGAGPGTPLQGELGLTGGIGTGALCSGQEEANGAYWMLGQGIAGQGQVLKSPSGLSISRGFVGVGGNPGGGPMRGAGGMKCLTTYVCTD